MQKNIFFISGLGTDRRTYSRLKLDFEERIVYVDWLVPEKRDTMQSYAQRLVEKYGMRENAIIVGTSFGGMLASEISKIINNPLNILIASASHKNELMAWLPIVTKLRLNKVVPKGMFTRPGRFTERLMGVPNNVKSGYLREGVEMFRQMIKDMHPDFIWWGIDSVVNWKHDERLPNIIKIHGDRDKLIPIYNQPDDYLIKGGSHFLVWTRAKEVSEILNKVVLEQA
ncbi:alpha/beta hydrolase [Limibacter armeniacum]|uniref:alpha/beta fold hydrolase n=1 Tax=Limibacter armeniacum TaxID=466084 RepID=UPI002FE589F8